MGRDVRFRMNERKRMKSEYRKLYSLEEQKLLDKLGKLFTEWRKAIGNGRGWFVSDGFYPKYLSQKPKILYMGRDAYNLYDDYIEQFLPQYLTGRMGDAGKSIDGVRFHKMLIQVAYGILHGCSWNESDEEPMRPVVPPASEICEGGRIFDQVSFAFMNLCKRTHEAESVEETNADWKADWKLIREFVEKSTTGSRNFIMEEISLRAPDIIITMNFGPNRIKQFSGGAARLIGDDNPDCYVYRLETPRGTSMIFDPWHFSARKSEELSIYNPLTKEIARYPCKTR